MADSAPKIAAEEHIESPQAIEKKAQIVADHIKRSKSFIVFTGAGISTSAGEFRGILKRICGDLTDLLAYLTSEGQMEPGFVLPTQNVQFQGI
tara:strand:+ start:313 stop:591 length:279 start_codon:yes stop_codon:yes gene_type:complete